MGSTDDPQALAFWQSSDVLGFSDYQRLFMFLEQADSAEQEAAIGELTVNIVFRLLVTRRSSRQKNWRQSGVPDFCIRSAATLGSSLYV